MRGLNPQFRLFLLALGLFACGYGLLVQALVH